MGKIANEVLLQKLTDKFPGLVTETGADFGLLTVETGKDVITDVLTFLKTDAALQFIFLTDLTAIHYPELEKPIGVIYHLHSLTTNTRIRIKVFLGLKTCISQLLQLYGMALTGWKEKLMIFLG
jgi:NADH-quinone oxidoreductase subunit C